MPCAATILEPLALFAWIAVDAADYRRFSVLRLTGFSYWETSLFDEFSSKVPQVLNPVFIQWRRLAGTNSGVS